MIEVEKEKIMLGCVYRPKDSSAVVNERINEHIRNVKEMKCRNKISGFLIKGDFNYGEIRWPDAIGLDSGSAKTFKDGLDNNFIKQFVEEKTFQTEEGKLSNILDLVLAESDERIHEIRTGPPLGEITKAHLTLEWSFFLNVNSSKVGRGDIERVVMYKNGDYEKINIELLEYDWEVLFHGKDVQG